MPKRTAVTENLGLQGLTYSAIFNIGDTKHVRTTARGIAVQKEGATFTEDDGIHFENYELFKQKANWPNKISPVQKTTRHHSEAIHVGNVNIIGVSQAAILQIGSIDNVRAEARLKHFRLYLDD